MLLKEAEEILKKNGYILEMDYTRSNYVSGMNADGNVNSYPKKESKPSKPFSSYSLMKMLNRVSEGISDDVLILSDPKPTQTNKRLVSMMFALDHLNMYVTVVFDTALDVKKVLYGKKNQKLVYTNTKGFDTDLLSREEIDIIYDFISKPPFKTRM